MSQHIHGIYRVYTYDIEMFTCLQAEGSLGPIFLARFTGKSLPATRTRLGKRKDATRYTAPAAAVTAPAGDRGGGLAAVGLSPGLLWVAIFPGTITMVARGINTLDHPLTCAH